MQYKVGSNDDSEMSQFSPLVLLRHTGEVISWAYVKTSIDKASRSKLIHGDLMNKKY